MSCKHNWEYATTATGAFSRRCPYCTIDRQATELAEMRRDAEVGNAIQRAAKYLPLNYEIEITVERGSATVDLRKPDGMLKAIDVDSDNRLAAEINAAIDAALLDGTREKGK